MSEETERGFTIRDRRSVRADFEEGAASEAEPRPAEQPSAEGTRGQESQAQAPPLPEASFSGLVVSIAISADLHLGIRPDPETQQPRTNLPMAKQAIDLLGILQEKTRGNLSEEEERLLSSLLYDLRMKYVQVASRTEG